MEVRPIKKNAPPCISMKMESLSSQQTASPGSVRRIFQPSELLQSFQARNFSAFCLSPPRQTDKGTYLNLSATTDGQTFSPLYVAFKDLKFVGQRSVQWDETRGPDKLNEKGVYGSTFNFQKFGTVQPLFEVLEKLQEYLFAIVEDKIKKREIACLGHRTAHMPKGGGGGGRPGKEPSDRSSDSNPYPDSSGGRSPDAEPYGASAVVFP